MLNNIYKTMKGFVFRNLKDETDLLNLYRNTNKIMSPYSLQICCDISIKYFEAKATLTNLSEADKLFLMMIQEVLLFLNNDYSKINKSLIPDLDSYIEYRQLFIEQTPNIIHKFTTNYVVNKIINCSHTNYFFGQVCEFIAGNISDLEQIDVLVLDGQVEEIKKCLEQFEDKCKYIHYSSENNSFLIKIENVKIALYLVSIHEYDKYYHNFTYETVLIKTDTLEVRDTEYAIYDLYNKFLRLTDELNPNVNSNLYRDYKIRSRVHRFKLNKYTIIKYFSRARIYKSKKKLQRMMKDAFYNKFDTFTAPEMLKLLEHFIRSK